MKHTHLGIFIIAGALAAGTASAHHSFAMFDQAKTVTFTGTVKEWRWVNPHAFLYVIVDGPNNTKQEWAFEGGSAYVMSHSGWTKNSLKPGDKVSVTGNPRKDGSFGAHLQSVVMPDGTSKSARGANV